MVIMQKDMYYCAHLDRTGGQDDTGWIISPSG
jgi:hypothetical protein